MGLTFIKLLIDEIVSSVEGMTFRRLSLEEISKIEPVFKDGKLDVMSLGLPPGNYKITISALADGLIESDGLSVICVIE